MTSIDVRETDGGLVLAPTGRLTVVTAPQLRSTVADLIAGGDPLIIIDLSGTEFVDSSPASSPLGRRGATSESWRPRSRSPWCCA
jgi:anti-sigma B factor antagonist